jgi:hypothetical protein
VSEPRDTEASAAARNLARIDPQRLLDCFGGAADESVLAAMRADARFADRLWELVRVRHDLGDGTGDEDALADPDTAALRLDRPALERLALRCGLVVWSASMAREVRRPMVEAMMDRFGEDEYRAALALRELAEPVAAIASVEQLAADVGRDGRACLGAWLAALPGERARRQRLCWPRDADLPSDRGGAFARKGPAIVRRILVGDAAADVEA